MIDTTSLFLHVLGAVGMLGGGLAQIVAGARLRGSAKAHDVAMWARFVRGMGLLIAGSAVLSLLTGGHLAGAVWTTEAQSGFGYPFITLGAIALVTLAPIGPMVGGARLRRLIETAESMDYDDTSPALTNDAGSPRLWGPIYSLVGVSGGLVALMVYKPGWIVGAALLLVSFVVGWVAGAVVAARPTSAASDHAPSV